MAKYTMELRKVCDYFTRETVESWFKSYNLTDYLTQTQIDVITETNTWSKDKLAKKIVDHYFMREIGFETPALFRHYVKVTMNEIMESKLPLIYSASIEYDPLVNVDYTETFDRSIEDERNKEFFSGIVNEIIKKEALSFSADVCKILPAELGDSIGDFAALGVLF